MTNDQILNAFILKLQAQIGHLAVNNALLQSQLEAAQERLQELEALHARANGESAPAAAAEVTPPGVRG